MFRIEKNMPMRWIKLHYSIYSSCPPQTLTHYWKNVAVTYLNKKKEKHAHTENLTHDRQHSSLWQYRYAMQLMPSSVQILRLKC